MNYPTLRASSEIQTRARELMQTVQTLATAAGCPRQSLFAIIHFQSIAAFGRARLSFHKELGARPLVDTNMFKRASGDLDARAVELVRAIQAIADVAESDASRDWIVAEDTALVRAEYVRALDDFGLALGYPVYDPGALSYAREGRPAKQDGLYFS